MEKGKSGNKKKTKQANGEIKYQRIKERNQKRRHSPRKEEKQMK